MKLAYWMCALIIVAATLRAFLDPEHVAADTYPAVLINDQPGIEVHATPTPAP